MPNINIPVDQELHDALRIAAAEDRRRMTDIVREECKEWLDRREAGGRRLWTGLQHPPEGQS